MCGIFGYFLFDQRSYNSLDLENMSKVIQYRGPDDQGFFENKQEGIGFGNNRLSIIDVEHGHQPFYSDCGKIIVVQNGEIFNYVELTQMLKIQGAVFKTKSDTEVILRLYEKYGISFLSQLNGMFAIAIYDARIQKLFLIRDRIGVKPLYFYQDSQKFYFASEIKSILQTDIKWTINYKSLANFFVFNYIPPPETIFNSIHHIKPGHYLEITSDIVKEVQWWELKNNSAQLKTEQEIIQEFKYLLGDAVKIRMRTDTPFGAFLSGGIDSSTIVGKMTQFSSEPIQTFSIGFLDKNFDETPYADEASQRFHTEHTSRKVDSDIIDFWPKTLYHCDQPHGDVSFIPTYILSALASKNVKVVLTGDGGDELFGGYEKYVSFLHKFPDNPQLIDYAQFISFFYPKNLVELFSPQVFSELSGFDPYVEFFQCEQRIDAFDFINKMLYFDLIMLLPGNNLVKPDRMGMAASIEARTPFLDYRMVEFAFRVQGNMKIRRGETRYIYKKAVESLIGRNLAYRKKQMFTVPIGDWLKSSLRHYIENSLLKESYVSQYLNIAYIKKIVDDHLAGTNRTYQIRQFLAFEHWCKSFLS